MKTYKTIKSFISLVSVVSILFSIFSFSVVAEDTSKSITATTNATVKQGSTGICYVNIDSTESIAVLDVTVHFDPAKVKILNIYNSVSCTLYDNVKNESNIQFCYIFDGKGVNSNTRLFYFSYQVLNNADIGDAYFDITIGEAYDNSLNNINISGSRCKFTITETVTNKTCTVSSSSTISTSVEQEFSLSYRFSTYQIASGSAVINYDNELFEVVEVSNGAFLDNKISDINQNFAGAIYISFVGTKYNTKYDFITVKFRTIKNIAESSNITFKATELCDVDLNPITCKDYVTTANISFDDSYIGDAPKMSVNAAYNNNTKQVIAEINLEANSKLGAGDFVLNFDPSILTLFSYEKGFNPTFFNVNDKEIEDGKLKFSIISLSDITSSEKVLTVAFDVADSFFSIDTIFEISGSMLSDSITNPIKLNFVNCDFTIPAKCLYGDVDCDGDADTVDYYIIVNIATLRKIPNETEKFTADLNQDGAVDGFDAVCLDLLIN